MHTTAFQYAQILLRNYGFAEARSIAAAEAAPHSPCGDRNFWTHVLASIDSITDINSRSNCCG